MSAATLADHCSDTRPPSSFECRLVPTSEIRLSEIIAAMSVALDITQGNVQGHCMRTALIGMRLAEELGLSAADRSALFYALLLKDLGCSSTAAKTCYLLGADDLKSKHDFRLIDWSKPSEGLKHAWRHAATGGTVLDKLMKIAGMLRLGKKGMHKIAVVRCERGADIARMLRLPEPTATAIYELDEHWDGSGHPSGLKKHDISLLGRICGLSQTIEVFFTQGGLPAALDVARQRRKKWFDPTLVDAVLSFSKDDSFWAKLKSDNLVAELSRWEPEDAVLMADEAGIDRVAEAFARVVDAKSPWTYQHSSRVAQIAVGIAEELGASSASQRDIRRAALLHDVGKLGVSNLILDKPGKLTDDELVQLRKHPDYTQQILQQVSAFDKLADVASAHHERLDGRGYHRRLDTDKLPWSARVLTVADIYEAMSAKRPYRDAMPWEKIQSLMSADCGKGIDAQCFRALMRWRDRTELQSRVEAQLEALELIKEL